MAEYNGKQGVWRTIGGRKIFIADGEDLETAMQNSGKFPKKDIVLYRGHNIENEYGQYESGTFFATDEESASNYGNVEKVVIDGSAKLYNGISSIDYCIDNNLMDKEYETIEKYTGLKKLSQVKYAMENQNGNTKVDQNANLGYIAFQIVAKLELEKENYDGAHWKYEDELIPEQYQIWNKKIIKK